MKLYVANIKYNMTEKELSKLFSSFGEVLSTRIVMDHYTRQSKNVGYVEMALSDDGNRAIANLNGRKVNSRLLEVKKA